jgi:hypothetical protein
VRTNAKVKGRWHDNRHTLITDLAESGAGDQTIMDIAGHVSKQMLKHYSHIRMEAKRAALESIVRKPADVDVSEQQKGQEVGSPQEPLHGSENGVPRTANNRTTTETAKTETAKSAGAKKTAHECSESPMIAQHFEGESLQKSLQSCILEGDQEAEKHCKSLILIGGRGRNRTYNLSVKRTKYNVLSMTYVEWLAA